LADLRAEAGSRAAYTVSEETGVNIDGPVTSEGVEVIDTSTVDQIRTQAEEAGLSIQEFVALHKRGVTQSILSEYLDGNRGVEFVVTAERDEPETQTTLAQTIRESRPFGIPGEIFAVFLGAQAGLLTMAAFGQRMEGRLARWRARRIVHRASAESEPTEV
jgi:hypothetical protein